MRVPNRGVYPYRSAERSQDKVELSGVGTWGLPRVPDAEARSGESQHTTAKITSVSQHVSQMACHNTPPHDTSRHETLSERSLDKGRAGL